MNTYSHAGSHDLMWPTLHFGPINLYSLPPAWRCGKDGDLAEPTSRSPGGRPMANAALQARIAELLRNRG